MTWQCSKCGICCDVLAETFFGMECPLFNKETNLCTKYEIRPKWCRIEEHPEIPKDELDDFLKCQCSLMKHLKIWKDENNNSAGVKRLLKLITRGKL